MANQKLKELMRDQVITINDDVRKKINYLINGEMFSYNYYKIDIYRQKLNFKKDNNLLSAFIGGSVGSTQSEGDAFANAFMSADPQSYNASTQSSGKTGGDLSARERIARINAKLSALRGVSMPGGYLKQNPDT